MTRLLISFLVCTFLTGCGDIVWFPDNTGTTTLTISTTSLPNATNNTAYNQTLAATGGTTPYTWTVTSGSPPSGITLSTAGVLSGTPTTTGTSTFTVQVTDSSNPALTATQSLSIQVV